MDNQETRYRRFVCLLISLAAIIVYGIVIVILGLLYLYDQRHGQIISQRLKSTILSSKFINYRSNWINDATFIVCSIK